MTPGNGNPPAVFSYSAPFGAYFAPPGIYTCVRFPMPLGSPSNLISSLSLFNVAAPSKPIEEEEEEDEEDEEPMHTLEPEMSAKEQLEAERRQKAAILREILRNMAPLTTTYFEEKRKDKEEEEVDFSDMPKLTRMDC